MITYARMLSPARTAPQQNACQVQRLRSYGGMWPATAGAITVPGL